MSLESLIGVSHTLFTTLHSDKNIQKIAFIDTETMDLHSSVLLEVGIKLVNLTNSIVISYYSSLIKRDWITSNAINIHKITIEDLQNYGKNLEDVLREFNQVLAQADLVVAHNFKFDYKVLQDSAQRAHQILSWPTSSLCTQKCGYECFGEILSLSLLQRNFCLLNEITKPAPTHRVATDIQALENIFNMMNTRTNKYFWHKPEIAYVKLRAADEQFTALLPKKTRRTRESTVENDLPHVEEPDPFTQENQEENQEEKGSKVQRNGNNNLVNEDDDDDDDALPKPLISDDHIKKLSSTPKTITLKKWEILSSNVRQQLLENKNYIQEEIPASTSAPRVTLKMTVPPPMTIDWDNVFLSPQQFHKIIKAKLKYIKSLLIQRPNKSYVMGKNRLSVGKGGIIKAKTVFRLREPVVSSKCVYELHQLGGRK